ncbi:MAG: hypothetical protein WC325_05530 [Candidatus Bathyarchaeia archaeon]|jgi:hypothetical protein
MSKSKSKRVFTQLAVFVLVFSALLLPVDNVFSAETTAIDKTATFLTDVICLDLTKYNVTCYEHDIILPDYYPFNITRYFHEQYVSYTLESKVSNITADCYFKNGQIEFCRLYFEGSPIYTNTPTDIRQTTEETIQRYQTFVTQNYRIDTTYLEQAKNIFNACSTDKPITRIVDNFKLVISTNTNNETSIHWIYTEKDIDIDNKRITLEFDQNGNLYYFRDTWSLYSVGPLETISEEEFISLALEAAKNCTLAFVIDDNGTTVEVKPDMTNVTYNAWFSMAPRHSATLYPYWRVMFFFEKPLYSAVGMQVGIWGDTQEIEFCSNFGTLGDHGETSSSETTTNNSDNQGVAGSDSLLNSYLIIGLAGTVTTFAIIVTWYTKKKSK